MKWTLTELAYLAGIIDGEGCFHICNPGGKTHTLRLFVMNTSKPLIDYLYKTYGGFQYSRKKENSNWKIRHEWFVDRAIVDELMPLLGPYLIIKKEHLEVAIEFRKTFQSRDYHKVPDDIRLVREDCHRRMRFLNKKGP
jgi:hypothetical protein